MNAERIALVTGANRGIGFEVCRQLLDHGLRVVMSGRRDDSLKRALQELQRPAEQVMAVPMDVTDSASIEAARRTIEQHFGVVDVLVNNAAVLLHESSMLFDIPASAFHETFQTNVFGAIEVARTFVPPMAARGYGRVVNVSSGAGQLAGMSTYAPAYSISKAALNAFTVILSETYRARGVLCNAVDPGWVRTDMGGPAAPRSVSEGADTIVWLATMPPDGPSGEFFRERRPIEW